MARKRKSKLGGLVIGPGMIFVSVLVLWKNEGRFDYYKAAKATQTIASPDAAPSGTLISYTGSMSSLLTIPGGYVDAFRGYLVVQRSAEIYAWDRDEDDDGNVKWSMRWMSSVQSNSRNSSVSQRLSSRRFLPDEYRVGDMKVSVEKIEFVDSWNKIPPSSLTLSDKGRSTGLRPDGNYFHLHKNHGSNLGDERVAFTAIPVPETATYFGKLSSGRGVAHQAVRRDSWIDDLIQDTGILHHLVIGQRDIALATINRHLSRLRWIVRGVGTAVSCLGFTILFSVVTSFLFSIPVLGQFAHKGTMVLGGIAGIVLSGMVIVAGLLFHHPSILILLLGAAAAVAYLLRKRGGRAQSAMKRSVEAELGRKLDSNTIEELEFSELVSLGMADSTTDVSQKKYIQRWGKNHGWDQSQTQARIDKVKKQVSEEVNPPPVDVHLSRLIKLALADGSLTSSELRTITRAAIDAGKTPAQIRDLLTSVRRSASQQSQA